MTAIGFSCLPAQCQGAEGVCSHATDIWGLHSLSGEISIDHSQKDRPISRPVFRTCVFACMVSVLGFSEVEVSLLPAELS